MTRDFNTHSKALHNRIEAHKKFGSRDLNTWIFENLDIAKGASILDLGCGRGKQSLGMSPLIGDNGKITAVDLSEESIIFLKSQLYDQEIKNISPILSDLDNAFSVLAGQKFDRAVSSYALYYTANTEKMISDIHLHLNDGGKLFFCGPAHANNQEIKDFHYGIKEEDTPTSTFASRFMEEDGLAAVKANFATTQVVTFENPLNFDSAAELYKYWSSYNLYDKNIDALFQEKAKKYFQENKTFTTVKRVLGVLGIKA